MESFICLSIFPFYSSATTVGVRSPKRQHTTSTTSITSACIRPRQHSSGGKQTLQGISKRGDTYLRTLLIHGARSVIRVAERKADHAGSWLANLMGRRHKNVVAVALANKNARIVWARLAHDREYNTGYELTA